MVYIYGILWYCFLADTKKLEGQLRSGLHAIAKFISELGMFVHNTFDISVEPSREKAPIEWWPI